MWTRVSGYPSNRLREFIHNPQDSWALDQLDGAVLSGLRCYRGGSATRSTSAIRGRILVLVFRLRPEDRVHLWRISFNEQPARIRVSPSRSIRTHHSSNTVRIITPGEVRMSVSHAGRRSTRRQ